MPSYKTLDRETESRYEKAFFCLECCKVAFIFSSFIFDIYKWLVFIQSTHKESFSDAKRRLIAGLAIVQTLNFACNGTYIGIMATLELDWDAASWALLGDVRGYYQMGMFGSFLLVYIATLVILTRSLRARYPKFYQRERLRIWVPTVSIMCSIVARVLLHWL